MQFNLTTIVSLIVSVLVLLTSWATGFLSSHPDVAVVLNGVFTVLGHFLGKAVETAPPPSKPEL